MDIRLTQLILTIVCSTKCTASQEASKIFRATSKQLLSRGFFHTIRIIFSCLQLPKLCTRTLHPVADDLEMHDIQGSPHNSEYIIRQNSSPHWGHFETVSHMHQKYTDINSVHHFRTMIASNVNVRLLAMIRCNLSRDYHTFYSHYNFHTVWRSLFW